MLYFIKGSCLYVYIDQAFNVLVTHLSFILFLNHKSCAEFKMINMPGLYLVIVIGYFYFPTQYLSDECHSVLFTGVLFLG